MADKAFDEFVEACGVWIGTADELLGDTIQDLANRPRRLYPHSTAMDIKVAATVHALAALRLIHEPLLAVVAESHVRALTECYAHMAWLHAGEPASSRPTSRKPWCTHAQRKSSVNQRALCLELGIAGARVENLLRVRRKARHPGSLTVARRRLISARTRHDATCSGPGRSYSDVRPMLIYLRSRRKGIPWAYDVWVSSSAFIHGQLPDRYRSAADGQVIFGGPASLAHRRQLIDWTTTLYANIFASCLLIVAPSQLERFTALTTALNPQTGALD
jgi:hypothetical protein